MNDLHPDELGEGLKFRAKCLNTRTVKRARSPGEVLPVVLAHNLRQDNEAHRHRGRIDPARTKLNEVLRGPSCPRIAAEIAANTFDELQVSPPRQDTIMGLEFVCQPPPEGDTPAFWCECLAWLDGRFQHLLSAVIHRDQKHAHMHAVVLAVSGDRLAGNEMSSGANRFAAQRVSFMAHIARTLGMRPSRRKGKTLVQLAISPGRGPKSRAEAARRDAALARKVRMGVDAHGGCSAEQADPHAHDPHNCAAFARHSRTASAPDFAPLAAVIAQWAQKRGGKPLQPGQRGASMAAVLARRVEPANRHLPGYLMPRAVQQFRWLQLRKLRARLESTAEKQS